MEEINWEEVLEQADDSPRGMLAELLAEADNIGEIVIVWQDKSGSQSTWFSTSSQAMTIAMLEFAKYHELYKLHNPADD